MGQSELWRWQHSCPGSAEECSSSSVLADGTVVTWGSSNSGTVQLCRISWCMFNKFMQHTPLLLLFWLVEPWSHGEIQKLVVPAQLSRKISPAATGSMHCSIFCSANWIGAGQQVLWLSITKLPWSQQSKPSFLSHDDLMGHKWDYHGLSGDISIYIYIHNIKIEPELRLTGGLFFSKRGWSPPNE